jgi:carboxylate-amine ligase
LPAAAEIREALERVEPVSVGLEEEVMMLEPETLELWPEAARVLARLGGDARFTSELPASQVELRTAPARAASQAVAALADARLDLIRACQDDARPAASGVHPFSPAGGKLNRGPRYDDLHQYHRWAAERQLVSSLQVHVAVGGADRTLAVYNALRCYLPEIGALAANAPIYEGVDTGLASVRPLICTTLPRQGLPPRLPSWEWFAGELEWGSRADRFSDPASWWWELRPHIRYGTLEVRIPDAQTRLTDVAGVAGFVQALVAWLIDQYEAGEQLLDAPTWRIAENRWAALRFGAEGHLADLRSGQPASTRDRLFELIETVTPAATRLGIADLLDLTRALATTGGSARQRQIFGELGGFGLAEWLTRAFGDSGRRE